MAEEKSKHAHISPSASSGFVRWVYLIPSFIGLLSLVFVALGIHATETQTRIDQYDELMSEQINQYNESMGKRIDDLSRRLDVVVDRLVTEIKEENEDEQE